MKRFLLQIFFFAVFSAFCFDAQAWALFGSSGTTKGRLKSADILLEKADAALAKNNYEAATNGYLRALERYQSIIADDPDFQDGLAAIRADYCKDQIERCVLTVNGLMPLIQKGGPETFGNEETSAEDAFKRLSGEEEESEAEVDDKAEEKVPSYDPRNFVHDFNEARALVERGSTSAAISILIPMINYDPGNRQVRMLLATARIKAGQNDQAIAALEDLRGRSEDLPLLLLIAGAYTAAGRYPEAMLSLDSAIRIAPADPDAYLNLAWLTLVMDSKKTKQSKDIARNYYSEALKRGAKKDAALEKIVSVLD